ncbi:MAG TPA: hypothetical protein VJU61_19315, partial [Polyangiaceae bacterium]|nr:hypothetical protein [Polyangiaceae bacterium]
MPSRFQVPALRLCTRADLLLFGLLFLFAPYAAHAFRSANAVGRLGLAHALATRGELNIDAVADHTIDKARHG